MEHKQPKTRIEYKCKGIPLWQSGFTHQDDVTDIRVIDENGVVIGVWQIATKKIRNRTINW